MNAHSQRAQRPVAVARRRFLPASSLLSLVLLAGAGCSDDGGQLQMQEAPPPSEALTDLDRYVRAKDPSYSYKLVKTVNDPQYTAYLIDMKSLTWRSPAEVDRPAWQHDLAIIKPKDISPGPAVLLIDGGSNSGKTPDAPPADMVDFVKATGAIVVVLKQVPNQPLTFANHDGQPHVEDGIIAFSWAQVIKTGDPTWSARFPMVKSAVLAMDTAQEFLRSDAGGKVAVDKFMVAGASKRGWTTWLTAAVDPRVVAAVPIVIDVLNVDKFMRQHFETYGFWARSLYDYHYNHITEHIGDKDMEFLLKNEDPYLFRKRLAMPKYIVNASGDQFFLPDGSQNYFDDLPGEKYLRYIPNADHSLSGADALEGILAYAMSFREDRPRPTFSWKLEGSDTIRVQTPDKPQKALLWQATNPKARDFRVETLGKVWTSTELSPQGDGGYVAKVAAPAQGYTAFFVELTYPSGQIFPLKFTTQVRVVPDVRPFAGMDPKKGMLESTKP
jgi:PhoPQ-activated pathogenicity-related protein